MAYSAYRDAIRRAGQVGFACPFCKARGSVIEFYQPSWTKLTRYCFECSWKQSYSIPPDFQMWKNSQCDKFLLTQIAETNENNSCGGISQLPPRKAQMEHVSNTSNVVTMPIRVLVTLDENNNFITLPEEFLALNGYPSAGSYINDCHNNRADEDRFGTLAMCYDGCVIDPGNAACEHGCPSALAYFEAKALEEIDE